MANGSWNADDGPLIEYALRLRYPIPYQNGIRIRIDGPAGGGPLIWANCLCQPGDSGSWYRNLRLLNHTINLTAAAAHVSDNQVTKGFTSVGTNVTGATTAAAFNTYAQAGKTFVNLTTGEERLVISVTDANHLTIDRAFNTDQTTAALWASCTTQTLLDCPSGPGAVLGLIGAWHPSATDAAEYLEGNVRYFANLAAAPTLESSGTEDYFGGAFFFLALLRAPTCGPLAVTPDISDFSGYRYHPPTENPIVFTAGCKAYWANQAQCTVAINFTCLYLGT